MPTYRRQRESIPALGWAKEYPIADHLGSTRLVLRPFEPGNASRADYEPFGKAILNGKEPSCLCSV